VLHPELAAASIHAAVVCGEVEEVARLLQRDRSLATVAGGPQRWEPLLLVCYGRMPNERFADNSIAIAELLLDAGADAGTSFIHPDGDLRFFALTGVMGHGEMGAPEHPRADELARLLLARGANPNDSQGLYNTHLGADDPKWLLLLFEHGLGPHDRCNWHARAEDVAQADPILSHLVAQAAANGHLRRLTCLLEHGADPNARSIYDGKSCWQAATIVGRTDLAELLAKHGARTEPLEGVDAFVSACNLGDRERAAALLDGQLALGIDPNRPGRHGHLPLDNACKDRAMSELLLAHGADPRARVYGGTAADPGGATALHLLPDDPELARPLVELLLAHGIDTTAVDRDGRTAAASLEAEGLDELADLLDSG
jgi:uncharacterized protein